MTVEKILEVIQQIRAWAEDSENKALPASDELIIVCDEIIKMIEREIDDLK